jgi:transposase
MHLSRHDLLQLDEAYLRRLPEEPLRELSVKLLADLQAAHERLEQNSSNSSRPPSSELPWQGKPKEEEKEEGTDRSGKGGKEQGAQDGEEQKPSTGAEQGESESGTEPKPPRRPGQQPGAPGHGRTQNLPIDQEEHHRPTQCAGCGAALGEQPARLRI